jgi:XRE family transcriptional regulator, aerobic/anaerobic benzoate catabolism transcriptional regulator
MHYNALYMRILHDLGKRIAELRRSKALSQEEVARKAGLSPRFLIDLEAGRGNISVRRLAALSAALDLPLSVLISSLDSARVLGNGKHSNWNEAYAGILAKLAECSSEQLNRCLLWLSETVEPSKQGLALVGLRGAGKTTIGKKVATRLGWKFFELDELIEKAAGMTLPNIFEVHGEEYYRQLEQDVLIRFLLAEKRLFVLATGGGMVTQPETYQLLRQHCITFWLKADPQDHWNRVLHQDPRPMSNYPNAMQQLKTLLQNRETLYARADFTVNTSDHSIQKSVRTIVASLSDDPRFSNLINRKPKSRSARFASALQ